MLDTWSFVSGCVEKVQRGLDAIGFRRVRWSHSIGCAVAAHRTHAFRARNRPLAVTRPTE